MTLADRGGRDEKTPAGINAPKTQALYCRHALNVSLLGENADLTFQFKSGMSLQPFDVAESGGFGNRILI